MLMEKEKIHRNIWLGMWGEERHNRDEPVILLYSILKGAPLERHKVSSEGIQGSIRWKNVRRDYEYTGIWLTMDYEFQRSH